MPYVNASPARRTLPHVGGRNFGNRRARITPPTAAAPAISAPRRVMRPDVSSFMSSPQRHGPDLTPESGPDHHDDVNDHEQHQHRRGEEVDRTRGLVAAE